MNPEKHWWDWLITLLPIVTLAVCVWLIVMLVLKALSLLAGAVQ